MLLIGDATPARLEQVKRGELVAEVAGSD